jgi:glycosyltransferase involved in cell wall biosynthesis
MLTSSQPVGYTRFLAREAMTLAEAGYEVTLVGLEDSTTTANGKGVRLVPIKAGRGLRKPAFLFRLLRVAREVGSDACHCFDPWALAVGLHLKRCRPHTRLVYDSTELFPEVYRDRRSLPAILRVPLYTLVRNLEHRAVSEADAIIETNATRAARFTRRGRSVSLVPNYPLLDAVPSPERIRRPWIAYTGLVSRHRGFDKLLESFVDVVRELPEARLRVMGSFDPSGDIADWTQGFVRDRGLSRNVDFLGWLSYDAMFRELGKCAVGMILLQAERANDFTGQPNKLFDFMAAGVAVIAGELPEVTGVLESVGCGWTTVASNPMAVSRTLREALSDLDSCAARGDRGRSAALSTYNWGAAARELLEVYRGLS